MVFFSSKAKTIPSSSAAQPFKQLGMQLLAMLNTRLSLFSVAWAEEKQHLVRVLVLVLLSIALLCIALIVMAGIIVAWFWDSYRMTACVSVVGVLLLSSAWSWRCLQHQLRVHIQPFVEVIAVLQDDHRALKTMIDDMELTSSSDQTEVP
jgi:uncharacterized membrane protein YqjE